MAQSQIEIDAFDTVQNFNACSCHTDVYDVFLKYIGNFGFDRFIISGLPPVGFQLEPHIITQNWSAEWYQHYIAHRHYDHDPIARWLELHMQPSMWSVIAQSQSFTSRQQQVMHDAQAFGLHDGYIVPLEGDTELLSCLSLSGQFLELPPYSHDALYMVCIYANETIHRITDEAVEETDDDERLTDREREILSWVAQGKTDAEIGMICGISRKTAYEHVKNAATKLDAVNRTQAVAKAIIGGQITL